MNLKELFEVSYSNLNNINNSNIMLLSMSWGGLGYLNNLPEKTIFLVRIQFLLSILTLGRMEK